MQNKFVLKLALSAIMCVCFQANLLADLKDFPATMKTDSSKQMVDDEGANVKVDANGNKTIMKKDGSSVQINKDGSKMIKDTDGTTVKIDANGTKTIKKSDGSSVEVKPASKNN